MAHEQNSLPQTASSKPSTPPTEEEKLRALEAEIEALRREWGVRGVSVAIVRHNKVLLARGFGERNEKGEGVTADTLFAIGSVSKAFTALLIGQLVEQGKLSWTTPVTTLHSTSFKDSVAASQANLNDILTHQTGLPMYESLGEFWNTTDETLARLQFLEPTQPFRGTWQYTNYMYALAGEIARKTMGKASYAEALKASILDPLNMSSTAADFEKIPNAPDHARSIDREGNVMGYEEEYFLSPTVAAGGISTCANDVTRWLQTLLGRGSLSGTKLVNDATFEELTRPHKAIKFPRSAERGYTS
ncbi:beta-lactamase/transpeptidase-like protein, partial [Blyttiomyces helicus]